MSAYCGIILVSGGETYRVENGNVRESWGALDYLNPGPATLLERFNAPMSTPIVRNKRIQFGQVYMIAGTMHVGLAHPKRAGRSDG